MAVTDRAVDALDEKRIAARLNQAALARAIQAEPAVVRRLFTERRNPRAPLIV